MAERIYLVSSITYAGAGILKLNPTIRDRVIGYCSTFDSAMEKAKELAEQRVSAFPNLDMKLIKRLDGYSAYSTEMPHASMWYHVNTLEELQ